MVEEKTTSDEKSKVIERGPIITWLVCAICILVFFGLSSEGNLKSWESASAWGYFPPGAVWDGNYWGLLSSAFVHLQWWHIAPNLYWLWVLGSRLEKAIGSLRWLAFFLMAAFISSAIQLGVSGGTGIGASGVVYAVFGFMWVAKQHRDDFRDVLSNQIIAIFLAWLFICLGLTFFNIWKVGNAAHFAGLLFGIIVADTFVVKYKPRLAIIAGMLLGIASVVPLFWCPWSAVWVGKQAYNAHSRGDYATAVILYRRSLELGKDPVWVWSNLVLAYKKIGDQANYEEALERLRHLDEEAAQAVE